jgi:hypothetical protein
MISDPHRATMEPRARSLRWAGFIAPLVGAVIAFSAQAGNLSFLNNSPISLFQPEDVQLMTQNANKVLDSSNPAAKESWSNPQTGASGFAQAKGQFTATDGAPCKRLRVMNKARNLQNDAIYTVCKYPDRGWVINTDARPAGG